MAVLPQLVRKRLLINSAAIFGGEAIARLSTFLVAIVVARHFGPVALGQYGYAVSWASILLIVPDFGLHLYTVRELSTNPGRLRVVFWSMHYLKLVLVGALLLFTFLIGRWGFPGGARGILLYILVGRVILQTLSQGCMAVFKAREQMHHIAVQQFLNSGVVAAWIGVSLAFHASLALVVVGLVVGQVAETCLGWQVIGVNFPPGRPIQWNSEIITAMAVAIAPIGITAILQAFNLRIDILVLGCYVSDRVLGQFQAAAWFPVATYLGASLLMTVLFPKLSRSLRNTSAQGRAYVVSLLKNGVLLAGLGGLLVWFAAPTLLLLLFGKGSAPATSFLRILTPMLPLVFLNTALFYVFLAAERRLVCLGTLALGVIAGLALSFGLTVTYGAAGCAIADVVREFIISVTYLYFLAQGDHARIAGTALLRVLAGATALMALGALLTTPIHYGDRWVPAWMVVVLTGTLVVMGLPCRQEWQLLTDDSL